MRRIPILILALLLTGTAGANEILGYEAALELALARDFGIRLARESAAESRVQAGYAKSGFLPRLDASGGWQLVDGSETSTSASSLGDTELEAMSAGLSLSWTLFDGFAMFVDAKRYRELAALGESRAREQIEGRIGAVHAAYYDLVQQDLLLSVAAQNQALSADRLERERQKRELGGLSSAAFLSAQTAYNADRAAFLSQEIARISARTELALMLGPGLDPDFAVADAIPLPPLDATGAELAARARAGNSGLASAGLDRDLALRDLQGARAAWWPTLQASAGWAWSDQTLGGDPELLPADIETESSDLSVGLNLSFDLFDGDRKRLRVQSSRAALRRADIAVEEAAVRLEADFAVAIAVWERRAELAELEAQNVAAAEVRLELETERFRAGSATSLDFRDAQQAFAQARAAEIRARYQARLARHEIDRLVGILPAR